MNNEITIDDKYQTYRINIAREKTTVQICGSFVYKHTVLEIAIIEDGDTLYRSAPYTLTYPFKEGMADIRLDHVNQVYEKYLSSLEK